MSTYLELCQQLRLDVGAAGEGPTTVLDQVGEYKRLVKWVADADVYIQTRWEDWRFAWTDYTFTTTVDLSVYPLSSLPDRVPAVPALTMPNDVKRWNEEAFVYNHGTDEYIELAYTQWRDDRRRSQYHAAPLTSGTSTSISVKPNRDLVLNPPPDQAVTVYTEFWRRPRRMVANDDVSIIPAQFHRVIVEKAKLYYAEYEDAPEIAAMAGAEYTEWMERLESSELDQGHYRRRSSVPDDEFVVRVA